MLRKHWNPATALVAVAVWTTSAARAEDASSLADALGRSTSILDTRVRFETVDQDPMAQDAEATTFRARLGFETGKLAQTALLAEGEFVWPWVDHYRGDSSTMDRAAYPIVADPESQEINRLQLTNTTLPGTTVTVGRQRIALDDHRFIGNSPWRQNEQTFDGLRIVNRTIADLTVDVSYLSQANRVFGRESPQGRYRGDMYLFNLAYQAAPGKITGFAYLFDLDPLTRFPGLAAAQAAALNPVRVSTETYGARFAGDRQAGKIKVGYIASYATQRDYGQNPFDFSLDYALLELTGTYRQFSIGGGYESLQGNGTVGFSTPLGTLHRFQGWADKFLTTPPNGIDDAYVTASASFKDVGSLDAVTAIVTYHDYDAEHISQSYGSEIDLQLQAKWGHCSAAIKYADYQADHLLTDTAKLWVQFEYAR
jgi:hypothetical protein